MKKIIDGKRYDTETADEIDTWSNSYGISDFKHCAETLYRTPKGAWFIYGTGGAMSRWARSLGDNTTTGGEGIKPLTSDEAREWLENYATAEILEKYFSASIEDA